MGSSSSRRESICQSNRPGEISLGCCRRQRTGGVVELNRHAVSSVSSSFPLRRVLHPGVRAGAVDEGQGVVNYVPAFATDEPLSADADAIFLRASLAGQGHRPVGQLPHDASRIIGHPLASQAPSRSVRSCRLFVSKKVLSRKGLCHRCSGLALSTATRFQEPHMQSEVVPTAAAGFQRLAAASAAWLLIGVLTCCPSMAAWPDRTITIIVQFAPGGSNDLLGRILAAELAPALGQNVIVENHPGAAGNIGAAALARATPTATHWGFCPAPYSSTRTSPRSPTTRSRILHRSPI